MRHNSSSTHMGVVYLTTSNTYVRSLLVLAMATLWVYSLPFTLSFLGFSFVCFISTKAFIRLLIKSLLPVVVVVIIFGIKPVILVTGYAIRDTQYNPFEHLCMEKMYSLQKKTARYFAHYNQQAMNSIRKRGWKAGQF